MNDLESTGERRQSLLVDKPFQFGLMRLLGAMWLVNMVVLGGLIYYLYVGPVFRVDHLEGQANLETLNSSPPQFGVLLTLGAIFGLGLSCVVGLHMSHQIAGPLAQVKTRLRDVANGNWSGELRFRQGDYLTDLPDCFNEMVQSLRVRESHEVDTLRAIEATLEKSSPERAQLHALIAEKEALLSETPKPASSDTGESSKQSEPLPAH